MKIALRSSDRFCGTAEQAWKILPNGLREFTMHDGGGRANQLHDLNDVFTIFVPRCCNLVIDDDTYDWDIPRSIDAAFIVAGDLYLEGKFYQSVQMILIAAILREMISDFGMLFTLSELVESNETLTILTMDNLATNRFTHIRHAGVNTRTTKLLRDYLGNVYPSETIWKRKLLGATNLVLSKDNRQLFNHSGIILDREVGRELMTLFCQFGPDYYREVQISEDSTLLQLFKTQRSLTLTQKFHQQKFEKSFIIRPIEECIIRAFGKVGNFVHVNDTEFHLLTSAQRSLKELGIKEGDTIWCQIKKFKDGAHEVGDGESTIQQCETTPRNAKKKRNGKKKRKAKKSSSPLTAYQKPTDQQDKEAHSKKMESVLNELCPQLQQIRRKLDSLTLQRQLPKTKKGVKGISHGDKENIDNFSNLPGAKAGKAVYPILVGLESNLYNSSKVSRNKKAISLDLHGQSKKQALKTLQETLPRWVDTAMKGEHPWVIPVNVICGGGSQELSEVVSAWIRRESQVANRPKSFI